MSEICLEIQFQLTSYNSYMGKVKSGKDQKNVICYDQYFKKKKSNFITTNKRSFQHLYLNKFFSLFFKDNPTLRKNVSCLINCRY